MLRHACGFKLANDGHDTRALQAWLGHKNIQHTTGCLKNDVSASVDGACLLNDADGPDGGLATMKSKLAGAAVLAAAGHA
jgi:hypothetical protein